jgi:hypothetical protein
MTHEDQVWTQRRMKKERWGRKMEGPWKGLRAGALSNRHERRRARARITRWKSERPPVCTRQPLLSFRELVSSRSRPIPSFSAKAGKRILAAFSTVWSARNGTT